MSQAASASQLSPAQSPSTQGPARGHRQRTPSWTIAEIVDLIEVLGEFPNVHDLHTMRRNMAIYGCIAATIARKIHRHTQEQVHLKVKELRQTYTRATRGGPAAEAATCPYFSTLDQFLGGGAVHASPGGSELGPEGPDPGAPEGPPPAVLALESTRSSRRPYQLHQLLVQGAPPHPGHAPTPHGLLQTTTTRQGYWDQHLEALRALHRTIQAWMLEDLQLCREQLAQDRALTLNSNLQALLQSMVPRAGPAPAAPPTTVPPPTPAPPPTASSLTSTPSS
ncbi:uncharacterized protein LOC142830844 [Pelodiscus sinensis]|uniref:uncharacterized protein LOC142830844 n=1 Tax=Pelodiscus sinensis TaxID=13735 RepID=UPI003F6B0C6F